MKLCRNSRVRPEGDAEPAKYFLLTAPEDATLEQMVFVAKMRWRIERDHQDLKPDFGLGHYEGRGWRGFHHYATLSITAYAFPMAERLKAGSSDASIKKLRRTPTSACRFQGLRPSGQASAPSAT